MPHSESVGTELLDIVEEAVPPVVVRVGAAGMVQTASEQLPSWPTGPVSGVLKLMVVGVSDSPAGGSGPAAVKNKAKPGSPVSLAVLVARKSTSVESGLT